MPVPFQNVVLAPPGSKRCFPFTTLRVAGDKFFVASLVFDLTPHGGDIGFVGEAKVPWISWPLRRLKRLPFPTGTRDRGCWKACWTEPQGSLPPIPRQRQTSCEAGTQSQGSRRLVRRDSQAAEGTQVFFDAGSPVVEKRGGREAQRT